MTRGRGGLTLVEIIVVVAVLGLLVAVALAARVHIIENARRMNCASNLRQIGLAFKQYAQDNDNRLPSTWGNNEHGSWERRGAGHNSCDLVYPDYVDSAKIFSCPSDFSEWQDTNGYSYPIGGLPASSFSYDPRHADTRNADVVIMADRTPAGAAGKNSPNHGGAGQNMLYIDFHVEWSATDATALDRSVWTDDSGGGRFETDSYLID